jgi:thiol:disulfide interchange protein DsbD
MIPILSSIIVGSGRDGHGVSHARGFSLSLAYVLGMAITYAAAGVAAGLTGTLLAAALQNPWVLGGFALVFVALSLSMFGFYELQLPTFLQSKVSEEASHLRGGSLPGVAAMGALSAIIVGPCVAAPLAGALLYIGQTATPSSAARRCSRWASAWAPRCSPSASAGTLLPKSGPWMEAVKKAFGVILLATAVWLVSPVIPVVAQMLAWALLLIVPAIYLHALDPLPPHARGWQRFWKGIGIVMLLFGAAMLLGALAGSRDPLQPLSVLRSSAAEQRSQALPFTRVRTLAELDSRIKAPGSRCCSISTPTGACRARRWNVSPSPMRACGQAGGLDPAAGRRDRQLGRGQGAAAALQALRPAGNHLLRPPGAGDRAAYASSASRAPTSFSACCRAGMMLPITQATPPFGNSSSYEALPAAPSTSRL